jgi:uncharacterized membrane protein YhaH (DUF805 family)
MLGFLFGFNARLGRLNYFLASIGLGVVMAGLCFPIATTIYRTTSRGMPLSFEQMAWPVIAVGIVFMLASFSLQCMRVRDIGWDPVCVLPTWITILIIDKLVATKIPAWSLGDEHNGTIVGGLVNLGFMLALLFWPSASPAASPPRFESPASLPDMPSRRGGETLATSRIARVSNGEFGRRST